MMCYLNHLLKVRIAVERLGGVGEHPRASVRFSFTYAAKVHLYVCINCGDMCAYWKPINSDGSVQLNVDVGTHRLLHLFRTRYTEAQKTGFEKQIPVFVFSRVDLNEEAVPKRTPADSKVTLSLLPRPIVP